MLSQMLGGVGAGLAELAVEPMRRGMTRAGAPSSQPAGTIGAEAF